MATICPAAGDTGLAPPVTLVGQNAESAPWVIATVAGADSVLPKFASPEALAGAPSAAAAQASAAAGARRRPRRPAGPARGGAWLRTSGGGDAGSGRGRGGAPGPGRG